MVTKDDKEAIAAGFPWYGEGVMHWTRGKITGRSATGIYFKARPFVHSGYSGGCLFGVDGALIGVVCGYNDSDSYAPGGKAMFDFLDKYMELEQ